MPATRRGVLRSPGWRFGEGALPPRDRKRTRSVRPDRSAFSEIPSIDDPLKGLPVAQRETGRPHQVCVSPREGSGLFVHHAAPNRSSRSRRMPPANPVSARARATTKAATNADVTPATAAPDHHAPIDSVANTALKMAPDFP